MAATFDTLRTARRLKEAGAADLVAEAIAEAIGESREFDLLQLASKSDLAGVRLEVERVRAGMAALETRLILHRKVGQRRTADGTVLPAPSLA